MTDIASLDGQNRNYLSSLIRQSIADRIAYNPHNILWRDMRRCAGIPDQRHLITQRQAWFLFSVALYWYERRSLPTSPLERNQIANQCLAMWDPSQMFNALEGQRISATELMDILEQELGKRPAEITVRSWGYKYSKCPNYSRKRTYTQSQVILILYYARLSRPKAA